MHRLVCLAVVTALISGAPGLLFGTSIIVPNSNATVEGNTNNCYPFTSCANISEYQQVYAASQFTAPINIGAILFRPDGPYGYAFSATNPDISISLSTTSKAVGGLSNTFANNIGPDNLLVYNGSLTLSSLSTGPVNGPKDFDIVINLNTPFWYDPAKGNLLLDVYENSAFTDATAFDAVDGGVLTSRVYVYSSGITYSDSLGLVTRFDSTTTIPEPGTLLLLGIGLVGLIGCGWRQRKM
jgi:hypothetical protein